MLLSSVPTLRRKKGTEKLAPVICAHAEAEEGHREACSYLLCPRCDGIEAQEGVRRIGKSKDSDLCASAHRCPHYAYARLIARVTFKLVCRKYPQKDEFRTKKILNQEFLYEISSFCTLSENNGLLHGNISCFCIFLAKNGVFNTNRTPRVADSNSPQ